MRKISLPSLNPFRQRRNDCRSAVTVCGFDSLLADIGTGRARTLAVQPFGQGAAQRQEIREKMDIETELLYASRMILAALIGGLIGWERERHDSDAGIRTFMSIAIGACAFSLVSIHAANAANDATRIAAQIVSGIGFIGAGVIFQGKGGVAGLTTAATLWATAAVGMASAFGMYLLAILTGGLILGTLALHHLPGWKKISKKDGDQNHRD